MLLIKYLEIPLHVGAQKFDYNFWVLHIAYTTLIALHCSVHCSTDKSMEAGNLTEFYWFDEDQTLWPIVSTYLFMAVRGRT
jgi:hypothetical protein